MVPHHKAWLMAHPGRTVEWLREKIRDGFQVHHLDENHENNDPWNLVLIEVYDHIRLHGLFKFTLPNKEQWLEARRKGGRNRAASLTARQRSRIARKAARTRWKRVQPKKLSTPQRLQTLP